MKPFWQFIKDGLSEKNGQPSSTRLNNFYAIIQWVPSITFGFVFCVITGNETLVLGYLAILAGLIAGILGIKAWNDKIKKDNKDA